MLLRPDSKSSFCEKRNAFVIDGSPFDHFGQMGSSVAVEILRSTKKRQFIAGADCHVFWHQLGPIIWKKILAPMLV